MKKNLRIAALCVTVLIAAILATFAGINGIDTVKKVQGTPFSSDHALTAASAFTTEQTTEETTSTTVPATTRPADNDKSVIDLDSLTIIDLYPLSFAGGDWDIKHCQGIAVDRINGYVYYSYTTMLVKCDWNGNLVGSVTGISGHLGDISYNEADGKLYCGYYSANHKGFYAVIFNVDKITKMDMAPAKDLVRTVFINEAWEDFRTDLNGDGIISSLNDHRYGCTGIDAVCFGPSFSNPDPKKKLLTIGYIIYSSAEREDNDYQVLLQYDVTNWWSEIAKPYSTTEHRNGPEEPDGKYFVYTGNTLYGTQTLEYFEELNLWFLNCYKTRKPQFNKFTLFVVDGDVKPVKKKLLGQPEKDKQYVLSLYQDGEYDAEHDIYGWHSSFGVQGMAYVSDGLFYIARPYKNWTGTKAAICYLYVWNPNQKNPFQIAVNIGDDYSITKKPRIETTAETTEQETETQAESGFDENAAGNINSTILS